MDYTYHLPAVLGTVQGPAREYAFRKAGHVHDAFIEWTVLTTQLTHVSGNGLLARPGHAEGFTVACNFTLPAHSFQLSWREVSGDGLVVESGGGGRALVRQVTFGAGRMPPSYGRSGYLSPSGFIPGSCIGLVATKEITMVMVDARCSAV